MTGLKLNGSRELPWDFWCQNSVTPLVPEPFERVLKRVRGMSLEGGSEIEIRDYWPMSEAV